MDSIRIKVDIELKNKIPPLSADEFKKLEENIVSDGEVIEPLILWNDTIIDGHHRWEIIQRHPEIPYKVKHMEFPDKWAAIVWMCRNQLGRRNLTEEQRTYLLGKEYEAQKKTISNPRGKNQFSEVGYHYDTQPKDRTRDLIAKEHGLGSSTVIRAEQFSQSVDNAEGFSPGFREGILSGEIKAPKNVITELRNVPETKKVEAIEAIRAGDVNAAKKIIRTVQMPIPMPEKDEDAPAFDAEDFYGVIIAAVNNFDSALRLHMVLSHSEMLKTPEGRQAAETALNKGKEILEKYINMINREDH